MSSDSKLLLMKCLTELMNSNSSMFSREAIETLLKIHRNILYNKDEVKYRKLKIQNPQFYSKIWSSKHLQNFLCASGWIQVNDTLLFNMDENLKDIIEVLVEHRNIIPTETHMVCVIKDSKTRELELRAKAKIERNKELEEFYKDKKYREEIAAQIKAEIKADRKRRNLLQ